MSKKGILAEITHLITLDDVDYEVDPETSAAFKTLLDGGDWIAIQAFAERIKARFERVKA